MRESTALVNGKWVRRWIFDDAEDFERHRGLLTPHLVAEYEKQFYPDGQLPMTRQDALVTCEKIDGSDLDQSWREPASELSSSPAEGVSITTTEVYPTPSTSPEHSPRSSMSLGSLGLKRARVDEAFELHHGHCCYAIPIFAKITCLTGIFKGTVQYHHLIPRERQAESASKYTLPASTRQRIAREATTPLLAASEDWECRSMKYVLREMYDALANIYDLEMIGINNGSHWTAEYNGNVIDSDKMLGELVEEFLVSETGLNGEPLVLCPYLGRFKVRKSSTASSGQSVVERSSAGKKSSTSSSANKVYGKPRARTGAAERGGRAMKTVSWEEDVNSGSSQRMVDGVSPVKRPRLGKV
ncbi:hypothetical protein RUND412_008959 [Rhizina undulata]